MIALPRQAQDKLKQTSRKNPSLAAIYTLERTFYQDRLGTNIGKNYTKRTVFAQIEGLVNVFAAPPEGSLPLVAQRTRPEIQCGNYASFFGVFPMLVPSLSW
jgi:hypothetical protein